MSCIVFGARGLVGSYIRDHLNTAGEPIYAVSRQYRPSGRERWIIGDLARVETLSLPIVETIFCATNARTFADALPYILHSKPKRVVVISSTSVYSKLNTSDPAERRSIQDLVKAELSIIEACRAAGTEWTILRPTLIYKEGHDHNVTQIAGIIRRLRFMPLYGAAGGMRQPVHAEDLARGAIAAARMLKAANREYCTTGIETISYREMVGRIFDALSLRRRLVSLPPTAWKAAFALAQPLYPGVTPVMGERMLQDLAFDSTAAISDFGWTSRPFAPSFR
jgi:nucleoside-diphosphate-sugar epimerase